MFSSSSVYTTSDGESSQQQPSSEIFSTQQQQDGGEQQLPKNNRFEEEEGAGGKQVLRAVWDTRSDSLATASRPSSSSDGQPQTGGGKTKRVDEASQTDSKRFKGKENFLAGKIGRGKLLTLLDAMNYCRSLLEDQLERAKEQQPAINESINGDTHAKKTLITLLPDQSVRLLFIEIIRNGQAWQRIRPLFGAPPYHFLKPEDAGLLRAGGLSAGRANMAYNKINETAGYAQFGSGHFVDDHAREYRVVVPTEPNENDHLPCDIEQVMANKHIFMNVRVPKRSRAERMQLLKDAEKRRSVLFPHVGEIINVKFSVVLKQVLGYDMDGFETRVLVKSLVPRSTNASTASMIVVKVN